MMNLMLGIKLFLLALLAVAFERLLGMGAAVGVVLAAIPSFAGSASYDQDDGNLDLSNELSAVLLADTFFLGKIAVGGMATKVDHYWMEDALNATYVSLAEDLDTSETGIDVDSSTGVQIGALLMNETKVGAQEVMQVTAITGNTLTVTRGVGDSAPAGETHTTGDRMRIIAQPKQEGDTNVNDRSKARVRNGNTCMIFKNEAEISGTQKAISHAGVADEYTHQLAMRTLEIRRELGQAVILSVRITDGGDGGSDLVIRAMDGVRNRVRQQSSQLDSTTTVFDEDLVNSLYRRIWDKGGEADFILGTADQMTKFSELHKDKIRYAPSEKTRGVFVQKFLTNLGQELDILIDRWCLKGDALVGDSKRLKLVPLQGRAWQSEPLSKVGDSLRGMNIGEYTLEIRNAAECFALANALTV